MPFPKQMETMHLKTRLGTRKLIYDKPGQKRLVFGTKPTLWSEPDSEAINPAAGTAEVDGRRVGQSLVAVQTTLEGGAPGKEMGHT